MKQFTYSLDNLEVTCVSQVVDPAIEESVEFFSSQDLFSATATHITGPCLIVDKPILRVNPRTQEKYQVVFTKSCADFLMKQILSRGLPLSVDHNGVLLPAVLTSAFQVSPFVSWKNLPEGSIILTYEASPELISLLRERSGFSMEILYDKLIPLAESVSDVESPIDTDDFTQLILNSLS